MMRKQTFNDRDWSIAIDPSPLAHLQQPIHKRYEQSKIKVIQIGVGIVSWRKYKLHYQDSKDWFEKF